MLFAAMHFVRKWHISEVPIRAIDVRLLGRTGRNLLALNLTVLDRTLSKPDLIILQLAGSAG
jgi:hypothetical protein